jgi:hypothetical protein
MNRGANTFCLLERRSSCSTIGDHFAVPFCLAEMLSRRHWDASSLTATAKIPQGALHPCGITFFGGLVGRFSAL